MTLPRLWPRSILTLGRGEGAVILGESVAGKSGGRMGALTTAWR